MPKPLPPIERKKLKDLNKSEYNPRTITKDEMNGLKQSIDTFGIVEQIACEQTDRICYGMEIDPKYVDVIRKRYWKFTHDGNEEGWEDGTSN